MGLAALLAFKGYCVAICVMARSYCAGVKLGSSGIGGGEGQGAGMALKDEKASKVACFFFLGSCGLPRSSMSAVPAALLPWLAAACATPTPSCHAAQAPVARTGQVAQEGDLGVQTVAPSSMSAWL